MIAARAQVGCFGFVTLKRILVYHGSRDEGKLTEQQHQIDRLKDKVEASVEIIEARNKEAVANNESAIDRLQLSNEAIGGFVRTWNDFARPFLYRQ